MGEWAAMTPSSAPDRKRTRVVRAPRADLASNKSSPTKISICLLNKNSWRSSDATRSRPGSPRRSSSAPKSFAARWRPAAWWKAWGR